MSNLSGFVKRVRDIMRNDAGINGDAQRIEQMAWMLFLKVYDAKEQDWEMDEDNYESIIPEECRWCNWAVDNRDGKAMTGDTLLEFVNNTLFPVLKGKNILNPDGSVKIQGVTVTPNTPVKKSIVRTAFEDANQYMKDGVLLRQIINIIDELDLSDYAEVHAFGEIYETILKELQSAGSSGEFYTPRAVTDFMAKMINPQIGEKMADFACGTGGFITSWLKELSPKIQDTEDQEAYDNSIYGIEKKPFPYILCVTNMLLHGLDVPRVYHDNSLLRDVLDYTEDDQFDVILMNPPYGGNEKQDVKNHFPSDLASSETADLFMAVIMYRLKKNGRAAVILPDGFLFGLDNAKVALKKKLLKEFNLHTIIRMPGSVFAPYTSITTNILFFDRTKVTEGTWFYRLDMPADRKHFSKTKPMELKHFDPVVEWWNDRQEITLDGFDKAKCYTAEQIETELGFNLDQCGYPHKEEEILAPMDLMQRYQEERAYLNTIVDRSIKEISDCLNTSRITSHIETANSALTRLVEIDRSFPDDMKRSILQLAIQGKLVNQQIDEGTGKELLQEILNDYPYRSTEINKEEFPFDLPENWCWVRLEDIATLYNGRAYKKPEMLTKGKYPLLRVGNLFTNDNWYYSDLELEPEKYCEDGDLLYAWSASFGPHIWKGEKVIYHYHIWKVELKKPSMRDYLYWALEAQTQAMKKSGHGSTMIHITKANTEKMLIPLPPLEEQKRIVAKLEEILPLCDRLK